MVWCTFHLVYAPCGVRERGEEVAERVEWWRGRRRKKADLVVSGEGRLEYLSVYI